MEIKEMTIDAIELRMAEIKNLLNDENCDIDALTEEVNALESRKAELKEIAEKRANIEKLVNEEVNTEIVEEVTEEIRAMENTIEVRNTKEYINAYAEYIKNNDATECRSLLSENGSGTVAVPELVVDIVKTAWDKEGLMSKVKKSFLAGNLKVGFERSATGAVIHEEGAEAPAEETLVLGTVSLVPQSIKKWITISDEAMDLRGASFLQYIYDEVAYQIAKKAADTLVAEIEAAPSTSSATAPAVPVVQQTTIGLDTIAQAISLLSDEAIAPTVIMNKATYASFKAVQYAGNYPVDIFEGVDVVFNNSIKSFAAAGSGDTYAIVGDLGFGAMANFPNGQEIKFTFDDKSLAEKDLVKIVGREYVALGVVAPNAFVKIQK